VKGKRAAKRTRPLSPGDGARRVELEGRVQQQRRAVGQQRPRAQRRRAAGGGGGGGVPHRREVDLDLARRGRGAAAAAVGRGDAAGPGEERLEVVEGRGDLRVGAGGAAAGRLQPPRRGRRGRARRLATGPAEGAGRGRADGGA
jgi:hypothetical protein